MYRSKCFINSEKTFLILVGNSENHKFQSKRFKPAFESLSLEESQDDQNGSGLSNNDMSNSTYNSPIPPSPKHIVKQENQKQPKKPK